LPEYGENLDPDWGGAHAPVFALIFNYNYSSLQMASSTEQDRQGYPAPVREALRRERSIGSDKVPG